MEPIVSIIIPTYNRNEIANACIASILSSKIERIEIIVVNDYKEKAFELKQKPIPTFLKIVNNPKSGVASARNLGAKLAQSAKLIFVDDDMILNSAALHRALEFLGTNANSTLNADWVYDKNLMSEISKTQFGRYLIFNNFTSLKGWNDNLIEWKENALLKSEGVTSQFFAINKVDFDRIGGYNENFPFAGFEDYPLYINMKKHNIINYIDTNILIYHNEIDRVTQKNWLDRKKRGAKTRKVAVEMGFLELVIQYSLLKKIVYKALILSKPLLMISLLFIPNITIFDSLYFKLTNLFLGMNIYEGYNSKFDKN